MNLTTESTEVILTLWSELEAIVQAANEIVKKIPKASDYLDKEKTN